MPRRFLPSGLFALALAFSAAAPAQEMGKLPFATLDEVMQRTATVDRSKVAVRIRITSKNASVKASAIALTIDSKTAGQIPVPIGPDGSVGSFPRTDALRKENPLILTNQPKGTLALGVDMGIVVPPTDSFPYARLSEGLAEVNATIKKQSGVLGMFVGSVNRAIFVLNDPAGTVTINAKAGPRPLKADAEGKVALALDPALVKENPTVTVSKRPSWIGVDK